MNKTPLWYVYSNRCRFCSKSDDSVKKLIEEGHDIQCVDITSDPENIKRINNLKKKFGINCGTPMFVNIETGHHVCGARSDEILHKWINGEEIPQPKGQMPSPLTDTEINDPEKIKKFTDDYNKWLELNKHIPNLPPPDVIIDRFRMAYKSRQHKKIRNNPTSIKLNTDFYYIIENGSPTMVKADSGYIQSLNHQYYIREANGLLTKVVI